MLGCSVVRCLLSETGVAIYLADRALASVLVDQASLGEDGKTQVPHQDQTRQAGGHGASQVTPRLWNIDQAPWKMCQARAMLATT